MKRKAEATWTGPLKGGTGRVKLGSGAFEGGYSFLSRFDTNSETNPEELLGAAHAACFSMALSASLARAGHNPTRVTTTAVVNLEMGDGVSKITEIALKTEGVVPGLSEDVFRTFAEETKTGCIISQALAAVPMTVEAKLRAD